MSSSTCPYNAELAARLVELTAAGLPLVAQPWAWLGEQLGISEAETLALLQAMQAQGALRRVAAVPNHYRLGYQHNGMTVWDIADSEVERIGAQLAALPNVSHCYQRPRHLPDWPYNVFAMLHATSREALDAQRAELQALLGSACRQSDMLVSSRILKKTGLRPSRASNRTPQGGSHAAS
ncbi:siroheme decarboxylase subunit beta [Atopomonas sediminilitoris]|uniref:siroheme decarboxylase subunit beta n=1 Tax=Atopomonas sediminilitoris TaxID=2919919 RepID=UPI001F4DF0D7|nr:nitrite reductase [Atopomonas sediminilitoris]MCJ8170847.1 nitrite reductase [Atopomonas sediminilitoris]